jgi:hypothetical protein
MNNLVFRWRPHIVQELKIMPKEVEEFRNRSQALRESKFDADGEVRGPPILSPLQY